MTEKDKDFLEGLAISAACHVLPARKVFREPIAYSYNGVILPKLPEWDREKYPYVVIMQSISSTEYVAQALAAPLYTEDTVSLAGKPLFHLYYDESHFLQSAIDETGIWKKWYELPSSYLTHRLEYDGTTENVLVWANHDILNEDGTLYLAASEAIPVYE